ncbi:MAG TPA: DUF1684 domain-containing protein [Anaerolineales bacterium]|nr:DUF1684 domain-containing protein [Anaerolineales bacterium]
MKNTSYENDILQWRAKKYDERVRENGWLALAGLFWLNPGRNLIGSNTVCEVVLPERAPTFIGIAELKGNTVRLQVAEGVPVKINDRAVQKAILKSNREKKPSFITWNDIRMVLHEHAGRYAIRIWDNKREERFNLPPLKWFPINKKFHIPARYTLYPAPKISEQEDTFGETVEDRLDGYVTFKFGEEKYKLDATEMDDGKLFIKFRDATSGKETYPPSRYLYTQPVNGSKVILDFNYAYSPPCAFTEYATCLFASPQNTLPFRVEAGEMYRG